MSFFNRSRGRHRAAGKLSTSMTRSMQATAAIAAAGGIAATAGASSASATGTATFAQPAAAAQAKAAKPANPAATALTSVAARPHLNVVLAKSLSAQAQRPAQAETRASQAPSRAAERATSRSAQRPATTTRSTATTSQRSGSTSGSTAGTAPRSTTTTTPSAPSSASGIVAIAQRYLGVPYVWGGTTPGGFDCSGLTQYVYAQAGISIPRTATAQAAAMRHVSNPQPGDLVVFGSPATHIGIYVGPGQMIAAPRPGTVVRLQPIYATPTAYLRA